MEIWMLHAPDAWDRCGANKVIREGGASMAKQHVTYTFENPNRAEAFEQVFRQILIDKLAAQRDGIAEA